MFNYQLIDLILFDLEVLHSLMGQFHQQFLWLVYGSLAVNIVIAVYLKKTKAQQGAYALTAMGWMISGYFFYIKKLSTIYWVADYVGYFCLFMGALILTQAFKKSNFAVVSTTRQVFFADFTITTSLISWFLTHNFILSLGSSSTIAALGTLALFVKRKKRDFLGIFVSLASLLWFIVVVAVYVELWRAT